MEGGLLDLLAAGGNTAMMGLLVIMWRFDRRILKIEQNIQNIHESVPQWECDRRHGVDRRKTEDYQQCSVKER
jgi:hypothetical protein